MRRSLMIITGVVCSGALAATALAEKAPTQVTLFNPTLDGRYYGEVLSDRGKCQKRREVRIYHDENGNGLDPSDYHIGDTKSDGDGKYELQDADQAPEGDRIIALVPKRKKGSLTCKKGSYTAVAGAAVP